MLLVHWDVKACDDQVRGLKLRFMPIDCGTVGSPFMRGQAVPPRTFVEQSHCSVLVVAHEVGRQFGFVKRV